MAGERYVALGLAHVRSAWFRDVGRWATSAAIPVEFVKCVSVEELRARFGSGRAFSALLVDSSLPGVDRDLVDVATESGCAVIVVDDRRIDRDWDALGVSAVLSAEFGRAELLETLDAHATMIGRGDAVAVVDDDDPVVAGWRGRLVAVTGTGGTGASLVAMALAQGLGDDVRYGGLVLLADLALTAEQAMLHDAGDVVPGVQELVEAHRSARPAVEDVRAMTFNIVERHYHLLLGLRRHRDWVTIRPRAFEAAIDSLRRCYRVVVADVDADIEGDDHCGSIDVEERNLMARTVVSRADGVVVVGLPHTKGLFGIVRLVHELVEFGVEPTRIVTVVNRTPRSPRVRAELTRTLAELIGPITRGAKAPPPVFLPDRKRLDEDIRDGARMPGPFVTAVAESVQTVLDRAVADPAARPAAPAPVPVAPGSLGAWSEGAG